MRPDVRVSLGKEAAEGVGVQCAEVVTIPALPTALCVTQRACQISCRPGPGLPVTLPVTLA